MVRTNPANGTQAFHPQSLTDGIGPDRPANSQSRYKRCKSQPLVKPLLCYNEWLFSDLPKKGKGGTIAWRVAAFIFTAPLTYPALGTLALMGLPFVKKAKVPNKPTPILPPESNPLQSQNRTVASGQTAANPPPRRVPPPGPKSPNRSNPTTSTHPPQPNPAHSARSNANGIPVPPPVSNVRRNIPQVSVETHRRKISRCADRLWPRIKKEMEKNPHECRQFKVFCRVLNGKNVIYHNALLLKNSVKDGMLLTEDCISRLDDIYVGHLATAIKARIQHPAPGVSARIELLIVEELQKGRFSYYTARSSLAPAHNDLSHEPDVKISPSVELDDETTAAEQLFALAKEYGLENHTILDEDGYFMNA